MIFDVHKYLRYCTHRIYAENAFHITGLSVDATIRDTRRREEDLDASNTLGGVVWKNEFSYLFGNRPLPTIEELHQAFRDLEDPAVRIFHAVFWMWPIEGGVTSAADIRESRRSRLMQIWDAEVASRGLNATMAAHNAAVAYHLYALDADSQVIKQSGGVPLSFAQRRDEYWSKAARYWGEVVGSQCFWDHVLNRMKVLDDPRIDEEYVGRFRKICPSMLFMIHLNLARSFARKGKIDDAKRVMVNARKFTVPEDKDDLIEQALSDLRSKLSSEISRHNEVVNVDPKQGECAVEQLLAFVEKSMPEVLGILQKNDRLYEDLCGLVGEACRGYIVQWTNDTEEWGKGLTLLHKIEPYLFNPVLKRKCDQDKSTLTRNIAAKDMIGACWVCHSHSGVADHELTMYGKVSHDFFSGRVAWQIRKIPIPLCNRCRIKYYGITLLTMPVLVGLGAMVGWCHAVIDSGSGHNSASWIHEHMLVYGICGLLISIVIYWLGIIRWFWFHKHPAILEAKSHGFAFGEKPSGVE